MKFKLTNAKENPWQLENWMETIEINTIEELMNIAEEDLIIYKDEKDIPIICIYNDYVE